MVHQDLINLLLAHVLDFPAMNNSCFGFSRVDILDRASSFLCNVFNSLSALRDDSNRSGNCFGSDGMIPSDLSINKMRLDLLSTLVNIYHDDFDTS